MKTDELVIGKYYLIDFRKLSRFDRFFATFYSKKEEMNKLRYGKFRGHVILFGEEVSDYLVVFHFPLLDDNASIKGASHDGECLEVKNDIKSKVFDEDFKSLYIPIKHVIRLMSRDELFVEKL